MLGPGTTASAQIQGDAPPRPDDAAARALFRTGSKAYQALTSYSDQGEFVVAMTLGGKVHKQVRPLKLTFARPNKLDLDAGAGPAHQRRQDADDFVESAEEVT